MRGPSRLQCKEIHLSLRFEATNLKRGNLLLGTWSFKGYQHDPVSQALQ